MPLSVRQSLILLMAFCAVGVGACSARPGPEVLRPVAQDPSYTQKVRLLVATTRERGTARDPDAYGSDRAKELNFAALTVSIPRNHEVGSIEWPDTGKPDPAFNFMTTDREALSRQSFLDQVRAQTGRGGEEAGSVLVFVHGYNTRYEEAVYRFAQLVHDANFAGTAILFAWPSRGSAPLYIADREASTYSRDYLEEALRQIAAVPEVKEVNILAHSMGSWLTVETLRQAKMKGHGTFGGKLGEVILASPDLDVTVFRTQLDEIGPLPQPMTILVSQDDKALALSEFLAGGVERAGNISVQDARVIAGAKRYNLRVVDLTQVHDDSGTHHSRIFKSAAVISAVGHGLRRDAEGKSGGVVSAVTNVGTSLLKVPAALLEPQ